MKKLLAGAILAILSTGPAGAQPISVYRHIDNPPDPVAQLAEMAELYDAICLQAFPDDQAVARALAGRDATPLSDAEVKELLHDDPGVGWKWRGRVAVYRVTVEAPPFHACGIRTMAAAPFPEMAPYRRAVERFEAGRRTGKIGPMGFDVGGVHSIGAGDAWTPAQGGGESLLVFTSTPKAEGRAKGDDAVEIRFVHQIAAPGAH